MRRLALFSCTIALFACTGGTADAQRSAATSWAAPEIATVVSDGLMASSLQTFRPDDPLTEGDFAGVLASFGIPVTVTDPARPVTMRVLDARLVTAAGLRPEARSIRLAAIDAGLTPTQYLGTEAVARLLGLRLNHPREQEQLELELSQPATRAEAAFSIARLLTISDTELESVREAADGFLPPVLTVWQEAVLQRALHFVGSPYVWAGTSERTQQLYDGSIMPGGFDCSGFVWRVYKVQPFAGAPQLATVLKGRTTYAMSGEVPRTERIPFDELEPADVVFFGSRGPSSRPSEVGHMGIYLGNGWIVHSSDRGVALQPLTGWYQEHFAWARRPLAEAGLE
jgi:cell wall-associated NlpC family hydrolase